MSTLKSLTAAVLTFAALVQIGAAGAAPTSSEVLRVVEIPEGFTPLSAALDFSKPLKPGDAFAYTQGLYSWSGSERGKRLGHLDGTCQIVSPISASGAGKAYCIAHAFLPGGQILFQGIQPFTGGLSSYVYPVTGGTGRYGSVRGWVAIKDISENGKTADVFHLTL